MAENLPEIGRLQNLGVKMDKNVFKNREPPSEIGRVGISGNVSGVQFFFFTFFFLLFLK